VEGYLFAQPPLRLLLLRRPPNRDSIWVPVSGKVDAQDIGFESALRRELAEETGLTHPLRVFPLDWHVAFPGPDGRRWRLHAYGVEVPAGYTPVLSREHDRAEWVSPGKAVERLHYADNREAVTRLLAKLAPASDPGPQPRL
jgi:8-oxo-dGTP pyrophosphatase MutT (NUDIX family)